jgi:hypothetical protein
MGRNKVKPEQASKVLMRMPSGHLGKAARVGKSVWWHELWWYSASN